MCCASQRKTTETQICNSKMRRALKKKMRFSQDLDFCKLRVKIDAATGQALGHYILGQQALRQKYLGPIDTLLTLK